MPTTASTSSTWKNLSVPATPGLRFVAACAQAIPFADAGFDGALRAAVRARLALHMDRDGAHFTRPMHLRLLRRTR